MQACISPACGSEKANTDSTSSRATQQKACLPAPHMQASTCRQQHHDTQDTNHTRQHSTHHTKQQDYAHSTCTQDATSTKRTPTVDSYMQSASTPGCAGRWAKKATMRATAAHGPPWAQECKCAPRWGHAARKATRHPKCMRGLSGLGGHMQCGPTAQAAEHAYTSQQYVACGTAPLSSPDWRIGAYVGRSSLRGRSGAHGGLPNSSRL